MKMFKLIMVMVILISAKATLVQEETKWECPIRDVSFKGNDVAIVANIDSWQNCGELCMAHPNCLYFTFIQSNICFHMSLVPDIKC